MGKRMVQIDFARRAVFSFLVQSIKLGRVRNATITGVTSLDSKSFHVTVAGSQAVRISRVTIRAPRDSPNTDGVHVQSSSDVRVTDSAIGTGDDCVSVGPGTSDVVVSGVACGPGHGISVGSLGRSPGDEDVRRLRVANCTIAGAANGVRIKTWRGGTRPVAVTGLVFEDIVMKKVRNPVIIDQEYCPYASCPESVRTTRRRADLSFDATSFSYSPALCCPRSFRRCRR
jgi:galacturan 1,4-alpha-galacturonidase